MTSKRRRFQGGSGSARRKRRPDTTPRVQRDPAVTINPEAKEGRPGLAVGDRVVIASTGLYSGESGVIEAFAGTAIPAAMVRTDSGRTRQVRTVDLAPEGNRPD